MRSMKLRRLNPTTVSSIFFLIMFPVLSFGQEQASRFSTNPVCWGVKTNMVYNSLSFVNLGIDGSLGNHFGFEVEAICPWWDAPDHHKTAKMLNLGLEGRYYWHKWADAKSTLVGPYVGLHANGGIYDICYKSQGVRGDFFVMSGAVLGYTLAIEENWRMNFGVGFGAMYTPYDHYHVLNKERYGHLLVNHYSGKYTYVGLTKVELSVVWLISQRFSK